MEAETIVLRFQSRNNNRDEQASLRSELKPGLGRDVGVEVGRMDARAWADRDRDPTVLATAPSMPLTLIKPASRAVLAGGAALAPAWGIDAVRANKREYDGKGVTVAVLDTGIRKSHAAFAGVELTQQDFTGEGDGDTNGHGTHCAGTIFGRDVNGVRIGIARGVSKALIGKVLKEDGSGESRDIVRGLLWAADQGAHVINLSLSLDFPGYVKALIREHRFEEDIAASIALEAFRLNVQMFERLAAVVRSMAPNTVIVAAAGNESRRNLRPDMKVGAGPPAVCDGVVSVGAIGQGPQGYVVAEFSNSGPTVCGPGVDILSAGIESDTSLALMSGTSMAAPHVAGVAALQAGRLLAAKTYENLKVAALLEGRGSTDNFAADYDPRDVGGGLVTGP